MDDLKTSMTTIGAALSVHEIVKKYAASIMVVVDNKNGSIPINTETPLPESLRDIPRIDETAYKYL